MTSISTVGVIGSGQMGSGIAQVAAQAGFAVVLRSRNLATAESTVGLIGKALAKQVDKGKIDQGEADAVLGRITAVEDLHALDNCDLIVESIVEDLATKKALFTELDGIAKPDAILATNTSTLSVTELAVATARPQSVIGVHFFNPAPVMSLVEIVTSLTTDDATLEAATRFAENCGKNPVVVKDRAGFIVNALLFPYLNSAVKLFEAGLATRDDIDAAMKGGCGFPMGPFALLDLVGLDTSVAILEALYAEYGDPSMRPHPQLKRMVAAGHLGRKSGRGFYDY
jgi:3-hydroxybutyryl-CoA dehydrogenase